MTFYSPITCEIICTCIYTSVLAFSLMIVLKLAILNKTKEKCSFSVPAVVHAEHVQEAVEILTMWHSGMKRSPLGQGEGSPLGGSCKLPAGDKGVTSLTTVSWLSVPLNQKLTVVTH